MPSKADSAVPALRQINDRSSRAKRDATRVPWQRSLTITIEEAMRNRDVLVQTVEISTAGMSFLHEGFLHAGTSVELELGKRRVRGKVINCGHVEGKTHRVGVSFLPGVTRTISTDKH